jgi:two-component system, cell cycle response regulator CpdR
MQLPLRILLIDDESDLVLLLKLFLKKIGFDTISFTSPLLAFEHLKNNLNKYSLIITDLRMPGISGIELANKIRKEISPSIKIFLITAFDVSDLKDQSNFKLANIERVIQKPIKLSHLKKMINQAFQQQTSSIKNIEDTLTSVSSFAKEE